MAEEKKGLPDYVSDGADGAKVVTLTDATKVTMREPTVNDMIVSEDESKAKSEVTLISNLCMLTPADVRAMKIKNYTRLQVVLAHFLYSQDENA
ncbi:MAG: phage tail assembly protein [Pseudomonadota bacterium]